jgi:hypothetical protein
MTERIIYCVLSCMAALADLPHREILRLDEGVVAAVPDETLLMLFANTAPPSLLYYSPESYEDAVGGLNSAEIEEVVRKRRQAWAGAPFADATQWIYGRLRACLTLAAGSRQEAEAATTSAIDAHVESGLELMSDMVTQSLYDDSSLAFMLDVALEREAKLVEELADARNDLDNGTVDLGPWQQEGTVRASQAEAISRKLSALREDEHAGVLPFIDLSRAYFITPRNDEIMTSIRGGSLLAVSWKEGVVADWHTREIDFLQNHGEASKVLYLDVSDFLSDVMEMTQAQLNLAFERRSSRSAEDWSRSWGEHLNGERLYLNLLKREFWSHAAKSDAEQAAVLREQIDWETKTLLDELTRFPDWAPPEDSAGRTYLKRLIDCEEALQRDIDGLRSLVKSRNESRLEAQLSNIATRTGHRLAKIAPVLE